MFVQFHQLPLPVMFIVILFLSLAICWATIVTLRLAIPRMGFSLAEPLPIRDSIINACGALFALIVAFSAAGIWNDAVAARNAVQREADALENVMVLSVSLPAETQKTVRDNLQAYIAGVVSIDWPAMGEARPLDDPIFDKSEKSLIDTIDLLSRQHQSLSGIATFVPLLNQLLEVRHARLARLASSNAGVTWAQWIAMWLISTAALIAVAVCNSHAFRTQIIATHLYVIVVSAAYFVILAHDRPFVGKLAIQPTAFQTIVLR